QRVRLLRGALRHLGRLLVDARDLLVSGGHLRVRVVELGLQRGAVRVRGQRLAEWRLGVEPGRGGDVLAVHGEHVAVVVALASGPGAVDAPYPVVYVEVLRS